VQLEGLGQLKNISDFFGNEMCDLVACNIVPEPATLIDCTLSLMVLDLLLLL
jgi:hypothetical protein